MQAGRLPDNTLSQRYVCDFSSCIIETPGSGILEHLGSPTPRNTEAH